MATLPELQKIYETILQEPIDKSSFRRRVRESELPEPAAGKKDVAGPRLSFIGSNTMSGRLFSAQYKPLHQIIERI